jgi:hypothetical protein
VSSEDIKKGDRWSIELSRQLDETRFGIICVDATNINSPWLNFEAGALSKSIENGKVFPILFDISPAEIKGPISQFQVTSFEKEDFYRLVKSINNSLQSEKIDHERLSRSFEIAWSGLVSALSKIQLPTSETPYVKQKLDVKNLGDILPASSQSIKFKIIYADYVAEKTVIIKKLIAKYGYNVTLLPINSSSVSSADINRNGMLYYRSHELIEAAVDAKNILKEFNIRISKGDWDEDDLSDDLVL